MAPSYSESATDTENTAMGSVDSGSVPAEDATSVAVVGDSGDVDCGVDYYGVENGYSRHKTTIPAIMDKSGKGVDPVWKEKWIEVAPRIKTRRRDEVTKSGRQQRVTRQSLRIHCSACPVLVEFHHTYEYVDYDKDGQHSSYDDWHRYESANSADSAAE